jgi:hypothetical protein
MAGTCECGNEPLGSTKFGEFLDKLRTCQLLKKDSDAWSEQVSVLHPSAAFISAVTKCMYYILFSNTLKI